MNWKCTAANAAALNSKNYDIHSAANQMKGETDMSEKIYPRFSVGVFHEKENAEFAGIVRECVSRLRSQGFRISAIQSPFKAGQYDAFVAFWTPGLKNNPAWPFIQESLDSKPCLSVLLQGDEAHSVPRGADRELLDRRENNRHMEVPVGAALRRIEFNALASSVSESEKANVCPDCISVFRRSGMGRFILSGQQDETFARVLLALGRELTGITPLPEWIVYEDPDDFFPDDNGEVSVSLAKVGERVMDRTNPYFGAYHLDEPIRFRVPERLLYGDRKELAGIASGLLKDPENPDIRYSEANPDDLYLMDMDINTPVPDEEEIKSSQQIWADTGTMEKQFRGWLELPGQS